MLYPVVRLNRISDDVAARFFALCDTLCSGISIPCTC